MITKCPKCGSPSATVQANDITGALNLAKDRKLRGYCVMCDWAGPIAEEEQATIVRDLSRELKVSQRSDADYQMFDLGNGRIEVREAGGIAHMKEHEDGKWTVEENLQDQTFENRGQALDCARDIIGNTRGETRQ